MNIILRASALFFAIALFLGSGWWPRDYRSSFANAVLMVTAVTLLILSITPKSLFDRSFPRSAIIAAAIVSEIGIVFYTARALLATEGGDASAALLWTMIGVIMFTLIRRLL